MILYLITYPTFGQNMKKEYNGRTGSQATMSETDARTIIGKLKEIEREISVITK